MSASLFLSFFSLSTGWWQLGKCPCMGLAVRDPSEPEAVVSPCIAAAHSSIIGGAEASSSDHGGSGGTGFDILYRGHGSRSNAGTFWAARGAVVLKGQQLPRNLDMLMRVTTDGLKRHVRPATTVFCHDITQQRTIFRVTIPKISLTFMDLVIPFGPFRVFIPNRPKTVFSRFIFPWRFHIVGG